MLYLTKGKNTILCNNTHFFPLENVFIVDMRENTSRGTRKVQTEHGHQNKLGYERTEKRVRGREESLKGKRVMDLELSRNEPKRGT